MNYEILIFLFQRAVQYCHKDEGDFFEHIGTVAKSELEQLLENCGIRGEEQNLQIANCLKLIQDARNSRLLPVDFINNLISIIYQRLENLAKHVAKTQWFKSLEIIKKKGVPLKPEVIYQLKREYNEICEEAIFRSANSWKGAGGKHSNKFLSYFFGTCQNECIKAFNRTVDEAPFKEKVISLEQSLTTEEEEGGLRILDVIPDPNAETEQLLIEQITQKEIIGRIYDHCDLTKKSAHYLSSKDYKLREISKILGISGATASRYVREIDELIKRENDLQRLIADISRFETKKGGDYVELLNRAICDNPDLITRFDASRALACIATEQATEAILRILEEGSKWSKHCLLSSISSGNNIKDERIIQRLLSIALNCEDKIISSDAVDALRELKNGETLIIRATTINNTPNSIIRQRAVRHLKYSSTDKSLRAIVQCLNDPDTQVRHTAVEALSLRDKELFDQMIPDFIEKEYGHRQSAKADIEEIEIGLKKEGYLSIYSEDFLKKLAVLIFAIFSHPDPAVRCLALKGLESYESDITERVIRLKQKLSDKDEVVRKELVRILAVMMGKQAENEIAEALKDESRDIRFIALCSLNGLKSEKIFEALSDQDEGIRGDAISMIAYLWPKRSEEYLLKALEDSSSKVRSAAIIGLLVIGSANAIHFVQQLLGDEDKDVRNTAKDFLRHINSRINKIK